MPPTAVAVDRTMLVALCDATRGIARLQGNVGVVDLCDRLSAIARADSNAEEERLYREQEQGRDDEMVDAALADLFVCTDERVLAVAGLVCHQKNKVCDVCLSNARDSIQNWLPAIIGVSSAVTRATRGRHG